MVGVGRARPPAVVAMVVVDVDAAARRRRAPSHPGSCGRSAKAVVSSEDHLAGTS